MRDVNVVAPTGPLRAALVEAPTPGALFVSRRIDGSLAGVAAALAAALARHLDLPLTTLLLPNTGSAVDALAEGRADVSFMPVDDERRRLVDFGPGYFKIESTYLAVAGSGVIDVAGADRPSLRVVAIVGTTTMRASQRTLRTTQPVGVATVAEAIEWMRDGRADLLALSRDALPPIAELLPGSRIVGGNFQETVIAVAVPKAHPAALAMVTEWMLRAIQSGTVGSLLKEAI